MTRLRTHTCGALRAADVDIEVKLAGWVHRIRDHGNLVFIDLRDHYGLTQIVAEKGNSAVEQLATLRVESVIAVTGVVRHRGADQLNPALPSGEIEVRVNAVELLGAAEVLPFPVVGQEPPEEQRLRYRYLDLRRERVHNNIVLRSKIVSCLRRRMTDAGFLEYQTPILTASSPEGARDFLVPSRMHPGTFYALPQAPQIFKQLLMVSGFDRYFQIAPCFRDEDARADRSPGEFYQLDIEMSFVTQDDVFATIEPVLHGVFEEFARGWEVTPYPFPRIAYADALARFGTDKPDLRNPLEMRDVTDLLGDTSFEVFRAQIASGNVVRMLRGPACAGKPRSFFDGIVEMARSAGLGGLGYLVLGDSVKGPLAKHLAEPTVAAITARASAESGDALFFLAGPAAAVARAGHLVRSYLGNELGLIERDAYRFCWVVDYPMFEKHPDTGAIEFSHNPFSMPQGGLEALRSQDPLDVLAYQYDIVCNGIELSSGAIRNHRHDTMLEAFRIAGYAEDEVRTRFAGLFNAFRYGAPPHGGLAPGVDRIVMLLAQEANIREVIAFPLAQNAQDLMMNAPAPVSEKQLRELHLRLALPDPK